MWKNKKIVRYPLQFKVNRIAFYIDKPNNSFFFYITLKTIIVRKFIISVRHLVFSVRILYVFVPKIKFFVRSCHIMLKNYKTYRKTLIEKRTWLCQVL
jgi:hypothetical protein